MYLQQIILIRQHVSTYSIWMFSKTVYFNSSHSRPLKVHGFPRGCINSTRSLQFATAGIQPIGLAAALISAQYKSAHHTTNRHDPLTLSFLMTLKNLLRKISVLYVFQEEILLLPACKPTESFAAARAGMWHAVWHTTGTFVKLHYGL